MLYSWGKGLEGIGDSFWDTFCDKYVYYSFISLDSITLGVLLRSSKEEWWLIMVIPWEVPDFPAIGCLLKDCFFAPDDKLAFAILWLAAWLLVWLPLACPIEFYWTNSTSYAALVKLDLALISPLCPCPVVLDVREALIWLIGCCYKDLLWWLFCIYCWLRCKVTRDEALLFVELAPALYPVPAPRWFMFVAVKFDF